MLPEIGLADAYGGAFEYCNENLIYNDLSRYVQHPTHTGIVPGLYTDDTQMSIAVAEAMIDYLQKDAIKWDKNTLAGYFVRAFKRHPIDGYARGFQAFLEEVKDGEEFMRRIQPDSDKSGAAMRACPLGVFKDIPDLLEKTRIQAEITHNTVDGIRAAQAAAVMTHYFLYRKGKIADAGTFIERYVPGNWNTPYEGKVKSKGWMSVRAAITAVKRNTNLADLLIDCVNFTGDVDTVATIALGAASCSVDYESKLPQHLFDQMYNGPYGRDYLKKLDLELLGF